MERVTSTEKGNGLFLFVLVLGALLPAWYNFDLSVGAWSAVGAYILGRVYLSGQYGARLVVGVLGLAAMFEIAHFLWVATSMVCRAVG